MITQICDSGVFSPLDIHFARFMAKLAKKDVDKIALAAALVSHHKQKGHICLDLSSVKKNLDIPFSYPDLEDWLGKLRKSSAVGNPGQYKPMILDDKSRVYLYRYWEYQDKLAALIKTRTTEQAEDIDMAVLKKGLERLFPANQTDETDWQKVAAFTALMKNFCVISGGPGTGKTTTVTKILALVLEQNRKQSIALAAPTGKAAARLQESILREKNKKPYEGVREAIPEDASTIHRLLGSVPGSPYFRHNAGNPLSADVVVIDEASMVDMALMSKLVQSLSPRTRLILLGDKDQLASVEAGAVLGDICDTGNIHSFSEKFCEDFRQITGHAIRVPSDDNAEPATPRRNRSEMSNSVVQLHKSYRFDKNSGIGAVSHAVNSGDAEAALTHMKKGEYGDICWKTLPRPDALPRDIKDTVIQGFQSYLKAIDDPLKMFELFDRFRILCAIRQGRYGVAAVNIYVEWILRQANLIQPYRTWYKGRPVMITRNDYHLRLFNGDIGITLPDADANGEAKVFFPDTEGTLRKLHPFRLPEHETVYAMTVHKSQGSEFDKVLLLLPNKDSPVLTRELIYTGITRAKENAEVWGTERVFRDAVSRRIERASGLRDALWET
ncbi:exodeoxyribonuclease V subunit alpha [Desulfonema magnum]|nr:exodeoxyribonuclease V subunit alpha [Desulfonema magnum]